MYYGTYIVYFVIFCRAIGKAGDILLKQDFNDSQISSQIQEVISAAKEFKYQFDENDLFKSDELKKVLDVFSNGCFV